MFVRKPAINRFRDIGEDIFFAVHCFVKQCFVKQCTSPTPRVSIEDSLLSNSGWPLRMFSYLVSRSSNMNIVMQVLKFLLVHTIWPCFSRLISW